MPYWGHGWNMAWSMGLWWLLGLGAIVGAVWLVGRAARRVPPRRESATEVLRRRYASGEISDDEYRSRMALLNDTGGR